MALGNELHHVPDRRISVIGEDDAVACLPAQGTQYRVDGGGGVFHQGQARWRCAHKACQLCARRLQGARQGIDHEAHRLLLHRLAPMGLRSLHIPRGRTVGAVVKKMNGRIQRPQAAQAMTEDRTGCRQEGRGKGQIHVEAIILETPAEWRAPGAKSQCSYRQTAVSMRAPDGKRPALARCLGAFSPERRTAA